MYIVQFVHVVDGQLIETTTCLMQLGLTSMLNAMWEPQHAVRPACATLLKTTLVDNRTLAPRRHHKGK